MLFLNARTQVASTEDESAESHSSRGGASIVLAGVGGLLWRSHDRLPVGEGQWLKELVLPPRQVFADGRWLPEPLTQTSTPNPFGGLNLAVTERIFRRDEREERFVLAVMVASGRASRSGTWSRGNPALGRVPHQHHFS